MISFRCTDPDKLIEMSEAWDRMQATSDIMGYMGQHILAEHERPGYYMIVAEFGVVDPNVSALEEAQRNNDRPETQEFARKLLEICDGEPIYHNYDEVYRTG
jgi:hypothetical protein